MNIRNTITKLLALTIAVATLATGVLPGGIAGLQTVNAQTGDGSVRFVSYASIGLVPGEKVRLTAGNPEDSSGPLSLSFSYYMAHEDGSWNGVPVYESEWMKVLPRQSRSFDLSRNDFFTEGEPGTRRAEVLVGVSMMVPAGSDPEDFPVTVEVFGDEPRDGQSTTVDSKYRLVILAAKRSNQIIRSGFVPGEKLRYTFFNPKEEGSETVRVTSYTYDSTGNLLKQTDPIVIRPGDGYTVDIKRDDLPVPGEDRTGRLQVQTTIKVTTMDGSVKPVKLHVSMEHVNRSGTSSAGTYYTGSVTVSGDG